MTIGHRSSTQVNVTAGCLAVLLGICSGCQSSERLPSPVRGIWVTRFDYKTEDDVVRIIDNCADAGFNAVMFQVRGNGTVFYESAHEPWGEELGGSNPGFDPLAVACHQAHQRGVGLHAWVNVMPAWRGTNPPGNPDQLYNKHPEWFWYDQYGNRQALSSFYVSVNPCLPIVREYLVDVFSDLMEKYPVDGLHMDYIRFPNEPPARPKGSDIDYPYDQQTLDIYYEETGLAPADDSESWNQWRTDKVTQLVADVSKMMRQTKPRAALSAAVGTRRERSLRHFRDGEAWVKDGLVDAVFPMNYRDDLDAFEKGMADWIPHSEETTVVPGLWFSPRVPGDEVAAVVRQQTEASRRETGNFCLFAYASIFETKGEELTEKGQLREDHRNALLPFFRSLVDSDSD